MSETQDLNQTVKEREEELVELASRLIAFPNVSPPGRNSAPAQDFIAEYLQSLGCRLERWEEFPGDPNLVAVCPGREPERYQSLLLNTHVDVAEPGDAGNWSFDPFAPFVAGGRLHGRGASDMKGAQAGCLLAMKILKDKGYELQGDLVFHSVTGEEAGEGITSPAVARSPRLDFGIVPDISDLQILGQGGVITGWVTVESPVTHHDGERRHLVHAGGGLFGASAIEKMARIIQGLQELERHWAVTKAYPGFPAGSNTINPAVIEGGRNAAFIADRCSLWVTVHFYPDENYRDICREIEDHIQGVSRADPWLREHPPTWQWGGKSMLEERGEVFPSLDLDRDHPGLQLLAESHRQAAGKPPEIGMSPTVTDAGWLAEAGVPAVIYGPGELARAHAVDESVAVEDLVTFTAALLHFAVRWCNAPRA